MLTLAVKWVRDSWVNKSQCLEPATRNEALSRIQSASTKCVLPRHVLVGAS